MPLPKGAFKGLAKVTGPLLFWMAAGWAAYPVAVQHMSEAMEEAADIAEIRLFSLTMAVSCVCIGIALTLYGFVGQQPSEDWMKPPEPRLCPYCGRAMEPQEQLCTGCGKTMLKL